MSSGAQVLARSRAAFPGLLSCCARTRIHSSVLVGTLRVDPPRSAGVILLSITRQLARARSSNGKVSVGLRGARCVVHLAADLSDFAHERRPID